MRPDYEMTGAKLPESDKIDGVSFAPQSKGDKGTPREWIYSYFESTLKPNTPPIVCARNQRWKLYSTGELFDISRDVLEKIPVAGNEEIRMKLLGVVDSFPEDGVMIQRSETGAKGMPASRKMKTGNKVSEKDAPSALKGVKRKKRRL